MITIQLFYVLQADQLSEEQIAGMYNLLFKWKMYRSERRSLDTLYHVFIF